MRRRRTAHRFGEKRRTTDVLIDEKVDFSGLMLSSDVLEGLKSAGFERPSPIQLKAIPLGRCGLDLIAQAKSGTGKTCVFSVIALENINLAVAAIQVLVLAPTREIAVQIKDVMSSIGRHLKGLQTHVFIGGMPLEDDKNRLKQCHIAIGSPGRIKHLIESKLLQTASIRMFILDEADKLLDESFQEQINWIYSTLPTSKQMLALSATYPDHLAQRLKNYMKDPTFVRLNAADPALEGIRHYRCVVPSHSLPHKVFHEKVQSLLQLLSKLPFHQCLIFSNYQIRARNLSETLAKNGWPSTYISGGQAQNERLSAMAKLKEFKCRILISTDLTSRGIDAERVNLVINMDLPHDSETYLHRVGRAGRFGSYGAAVNFVAEGKDVTSLDEIEANCGVTITPLPDDVSELLSEEMMMETKQVRSTQREDDVLDKNVGIEHLERENVLENPEAKNIQKESIIAGNSETGIECQHKFNKMEANKEVITQAGNIIENTEGTGIGLESESQAKESSMKNGERDRKIQQAGVDAELQSAEIKDQEGKSLIENTEQQENDIKRVRIATEETILDETKETGFCRHEGTDEVVQNDNDDSWNKIENREEASAISQGARVAGKECGIKFQNTGSKMEDRKEKSDIRQEVSIIDEESNDKYQKSDKKLEDTKEGNILQVGVAPGRNLNGIEDLNTGDKIHNTDNEASILQSNIVSGVEVESEKYGDGQEDAEKFDMSDISKELEVRCERRSDVKDNDDTEDTVATKNSKSKILFRNCDANLFPEAEELSSDDFASDDSESEFSSSDETGSSDESRDSHVPISCKDFNNVFEAYLNRSGDGFSNNDRQHRETDSHTSEQSLKLRIPEDAHYDKLAGASSSSAIHTSEVRPLLSETNDAQGNALYANEASGDFGAVEPNNGQNSEETMFYGATPDDVTAYMAELPAQWKNTWYRIYDKQTAFIMKYTKFCHENF